MDNKDVTIKTSGLIASLPLNLSVFAYNGTPEELASDMVWIAGRVNAIIGEDATLAAMLSKVCGDEAGSLMVGDLGETTKEEVKVETF